MHSDECAGAEFQTANDTSAHEGKHVLFHCQSALHCTLECSEDSPRGWTDVISGTSALREVKGDGISGQCWAGMGEEVGGDSHCLALGGQASLCMS